MTSPNILMIVDDDQHDRFFFKEAVKELPGSYLCVEAWHGRDALEQLEKATQLPNFIFLDLNMPLMDGWECLQLLKASERLRRIPVIIYTTSSSEAHVERSKKLGAAYYLSKPNDISSFPHAIEK